MVGLVVFLLVHGPEHLLLAIQRLSLVVVSRHPEAVFVNQHHRALVTGWGCWNRRHRSLGLVVRGQVWHSG